MACLVKVPEWIGHQAIILFLAKTGIRRQELIDLDRKDLFLEQNYAILKPHPKRTNRTVFFDQETKEFLEAYLSTRRDKKPALFLGIKGERIYRDRLYYMVRDAAQEIGLHNPNGGLEEKFTPHCTRHWYTTWMRRRGCPRGILKELRGDIRKEAVDIYDHITPEEMREAYLQYIPQLGVKP